MCIGPHGHQKAYVYGPVYEPKEALCMYVCNRLPLLKDWMTNNREALFDMMITDEAHHYPAPTWIGLAEDLKEASPPDHVFNELLLTATPHHHKAGNLDDDTCRDAPALTPYVHTARWACRSIRESCQGCRFPGFPLLNSCCKSSSLGSFCGPRRQFLILGNVGIIYYPLLPYVITTREAELRPGSPPTSKITTRELAGWLAGGITTREPVMRLAG